ncbi:Uncharacterised protein [uncultured Bacteroides sp.]|nr:Uncharacterised protein [uncultured Bacteroides sp.]
MELKPERRGPEGLDVCLLIVPYGIETDEIPQALEKSHLLIVPYGIETTSDSMYGIGINTFNRTLWN